ncbi:hypothetical protein L914_03193 [Phytophthora nicotianae]|uniref:Uncharacterized protein n=1 Tax=Phytophthora nicotianae TaxID=4792 RepID=W2NXW8_PHYNI|nr:hypothetical protein L914_03193 [Phytophthora nicotianae]
MDLTNLDYKIIDEYENYNEYFVKVFGHGEEPRNGCRVY